MIEDIIKANTAAIEANTAALRQILAASGGSAAETPAPAPAKTEKPKEKAKPKLVVTPPVEETPEPDADEDGDDLTELSHEILVARVQHKLDTTTGDKLAAVKKGFKELREKFEVKTIKDLTEDQFAEFAEGIAAL